MKFILLALILVGCSSTPKPNKYYGIKELRIRYNSYYNMIDGNTIHLKNLGDVSMFLHEYGHALHYFHLPVHKKLEELLMIEYPIPPAINPTFRNRELQDFITTSTRWKVEYEFKHHKNINIVNELMCNLFVIFTIGGPELDYIRTYYPEVYKEYKVYYSALI